MMSGGLFTALFTGSVKLIQAAESKREQEDPEEEKDPEDAEAPESAKA
jgi:hypothetical protein